MIKKKYIFFIFRNNFRQSTIGNFGKTNSYGDIKLISLSGRIKSIFGRILYFFIIFNLWVVFRITEMNKFVQYFSKLYGSILEIFNIENFLIILIVISAITSQKIDNFISIKNFSKRTNLLFVIIFFIFVILAGLGMNVGRSEKFIYFQF